jgi:putative ABC transport system permease protein
LLQRCRPGLQSDLLAIALQRRSCGDRLRARHQRAHVRDRRCWSRGVHRTEPLAADIWIPLSAHHIALAAEEGFEDRAAPSLLVIGRLAAGASRASARAALGVVARRLSAAFRDPSRPGNVAVEAGTFFTLDPGARPVIAIVMVTAGLVLLIACANVANLTLARAVSRQREIAIRVAIGAARSRIVRQLLTEAVVLAAMAGAAAFLLSGWILRLLYALGLSLAPFPWPVALSLSPDVRVFAYTLSLAMGAGVLFGLVPARQLSSPRISSALTRMARRLAFASAARARARPS